MISPITFKWQNTILKSASSFRGTPSGAQHFNAKNLAAPEKDTVTFRGNKEESPLKNPQDKSVQELVVFLEEHRDSLEYTNIKKLEDVINQKKLPEVVRPDDKKLIPPRQHCTNEEENAIQNYLGCFTQINDPLRMGMIPFAIEHVVETLDNLIEKNEGIKDDATVYRSILTKGVNTHGVDIEKEYSTVGNVVTYKPYMSTSMGPNEKYENFERFDYRYSKTYDGITLRIHLPKGTKGAMVTEDEFLLPRNSKIKITDYNEKTHVADCQYILE